jgi:hypothetical protein
MYCSTGAAPPTIATVPFTGSAIMRALRRGALSATESKEIALKAPRRNARMIALPVKGTVAIVGGASPCEQYVE